MCENNFLYLSRVIEGNITCVDKNLYYNQRFYDYVIDPVFKFHVSIEEPLIPYVLHDANLSYYIYLPEKYSTMSDIVVLKNTVSKLHSCLREFKTFDIDVDKLFANSIDAIWETN